MIDCISVENMRLSDADTIANLVPSLELMHRAALGVYQNVAWKGKIAILAGSGNNGGDGYALSCILKRNGYDCTVFSLGNRLSDDSAYYADQAQQIGVAIHPFVPGTGTLNGYDILVDCLLGTGFTGGVRENYRDCIREINDAPGYTVSVDINSGMNGDTGEAEIAVCSDLTVTIGYVKRGLIAAVAGQYIKKLVCADIGIRLVRQEDRILSAREWIETFGDENFTTAAKDGNIYHRCPVWLQLE